MFEPLKKHLPQFLRTSVLSCIMVVLAGCSFSAPPLGPLHQASKNGDVEFVRSWIRQGKNVDIHYNDTGSGLENNSTRIRALTPLMVAAESGQLDVVKTLIEGGANLYAESQWANGSGFENVFHYALKSDNLPVIAYLWEKSDKVRFASKLPEYFAYKCSHFCDAQHGEDETTNLPLFLAKIMPNELLGEGIGKLACLYNPLPNLKFLAAHNVIFPKNTLNSLASETPCGSDKEADKIEAATFLLDNGADPNYIPRRTPYIGTSLMQATEHRELPFITLLIRYGAKPNLMNTRGDSAISRTIHLCHADENKQKILLTLLEHADFYENERFRMSYAQYRCCSTSPTTATQRKICKEFDRISGNEAKLKFGSLHTQ